MQKYCKTIGALAAASALVAGTAQAEVEYEIHAGYSTEYLFRGVSFGDDLLETGIDASTEAYGLNLSAGIWYANFQAGAPAFGGDFNANEIDLYTEVSKDLGFLTASVGYIYYYNDTDDLISANVTGNVRDFQEVYFGISRDFGFVEASLTYFWDIVGDNGGYTELGLSRSFELNQCLTLNTGVNVGYLVEESDFTAATAKVSLDWGFVENAKLSPFVAAALDLSSDGNALGNELIGGSMLSVSF